MLYLYRIGCGANAIILHSTFVKLDRNIALVTIKIKEACKVHKGVEEKVVLDTDYADDMAI